MAQLSNITIGLPPDPARSAALSWLILIVAGLAWGATFTLSKFAVAGGAHPIGLNFWQAAIGAVMAAVFLVARRRRLPVSRRHLAFYAVCGLLGTALPGTLFFFAARHVPPGVLSITIATVPMLTFVIALAIGYERPALSRAIGVALGMTAVALIVLPDASLPEASAAPWVLVAAFCAACYAAENMYIAVRRPPGGDAFTILCGMMASGAVMSGVVAAASGTLEALSTPFTLAEWSLLAIAAINVCAYGSFVHLVSTAGPVFASQMGYLITASGVAWGVALASDDHSAWIWAALLVMMVGLTLVKPRR